MRAFFIQRIFTRKCFDSKINHFYAIYFALYY